MANPTRRASIFDRIIDEVYYIFHRCEGYDMLMVDHNTGRVYVECSVCLRKTTGVLTPIPVRGCCDNLR